MSSFEKHIDKHLKQARDYKYSYFMQASKDSNKQFKKKWVKTDDDSTIVRNHIIMMVVNLFICIAIQPYSP